MKQDPSTPSAESPASLPVVALDHCENCGASLYGKYCYACGQSIQGPVRPFGSVISSIPNNVLDVDQRLFRTIGPLYLQPGKLTLDYFAGRRARYVTPFRLVSFLAIVVFFAIQLTVRTGYGHMVSEKKVDIDISIDAGKPSASVVRVLKATDHGMFAHGNISSNGKVLWNRDTKPLKVAWLPGVLVDWLNDLIDNAQQRLYAMNEGSFAERQNAQRKLTLGIYSAAPTVLYLLLPVFALLLKIFYIFKRRLYMEHLIVAMHSHAFLMLSMLVLTLLEVLRQVLKPHASWLAIPFDLLIAAVWVWVFVYLWLMQKRVYRQGWIMTTLKYGCIGFCYTLLVGLGWVFAVLLSLTGA